MTVSGFQFSVLSSRKQGRCRLQPAPQMRHYRACRARRIAAATGRPIFVVVAKLHFFPRSQVVLEPVGRESAAHPAFREVPSLYSERLFPRPKLHLGTNSMEPKLSLSTSSPFPSPAREREDTWWHRRLACAAPAKPTWLVLWPPPKMKIFCRGEPVARPPAPAAGLSRQSLRLPKLTTDYWPLTTGNPHFVPTSTCSQSVLEPG
jgi:hypothetical protein